MLREEPSVAYAAVALADALEASVVTLGLLKLTDLLEELVTFS